MSSNYYYRTLGQIYTHNKPNLCPICKHRQEYIDPRDGTLWDGYCTVKRKILSGANSMIKKPRCSDFKKMENGTMQGKRHDLLEDEYNLSSGEYGKSPDGKWFCHVPAEGFYVGALGKHQVTEHADGTISVSPSIVCDAEDGRQWHGYLERGVWRKV